MKYLKKFENNFGFRGLDSSNGNSPFIKNYGEEYPINKVNIGDKIVFTGTTYYVIDKSDVSLDIAIDREEKDSKKIRKINVVQFNNKAAIRKED